VSAVDEGLGVVVEKVRTDVTKRAPDGQLLRPAVEALDVVSHALLFTHSPDGLHEFREALWHGRLAPGAEQAVRTMVGHLRAEVAAGNEAAVSEVCDCLHSIVSAASDGGPE
jgi:hypothetical protein